MASRATSEVRSTRFAVRCKQSIIHCVIDTKRSADATLGQVNDIPGLLNDTDAGEVRMGRLAKLFVALGTRRKFVAFLRRHEVARYNVVTMRTIQFHAQHTADVLLAEVRAELAGERAARDEAEEQLLDVSAELSEVEAAHADAANAFGSLLQALGEFVAQAEPTDVADVTAQLRARTGSRAADSTT